ncbi:MAG: hypothetical protein EB076_09160, partial [Flavobacteriia bacterium]|nr:hypothetical protein [Flavobacteriia bacterium]
MIFLQVMSKNFFFVAFFSLANIIFSQQIIIEKSVDSKLRIGVEANEELLLNVNFDRPVSEVKISGSGYSVFSALEMQEGQYDEYTYTYTIPDSGSDSNSIQVFNIDYVLDSQSYTISSTILVSKTSRVPTNGEIESVAHFTWLIDTGYD